MKKKLNLIFTTMLMVTIATLPLFTGGCKSTPLKDALGNTLTVDDIETYGELVGETGYYVYCYYKNNPKYEKYTQRCEEVYSALEKAQEESGKEGLDLQAVNDATLDIITIAAASELGPTGAAGVRAASAVLLKLGYKFYKDKMSEDQLETYLAAAYRGVKRAKANGADLVGEPTDIDKLVALQPSEECGLVCVIDKVKSRLEAGGLSNYDEKRLKNRLKELGILMKEDEAQMIKELELEKGTPLE